MLFVILWIPNISMCIFKFWDNRLAVNSNSLSSLQLLSLSLSFCLYKHQNITVPHLQVLHVTIWQTCQLPCIFYERSSHVLPQPKLKFTHLSKLLLQSAAAASGAKGCAIGAKRRRPNSVCLLLSWVRLNRSQALLPIWWQRPADKPSLAPALSHSTAISANWLHLLLQRYPSCLPLVRPLHTQRISTPTSLFCIYIKKILTCKHKRFCAFSLILPKSFCRSGSRTLTIATEVQTKYNIFVQRKSARFLPLTWTEWAFIPTLGPVQHGNSVSHKVTQAKAVCNTSVSSEIC